MKNIFFILLLVLVVSSSVFAFELDFMTANVNCNIRSFVIGNGDLKHLLATLTLESKGNIYLDKNKNGKYDAGDKGVGAVFDVYSNATGPDELYKLAQEIQIHWGSGGPAGWKIEPWP